MLTPMRTRIKTLRADGSEYAGGRINATKMALPAGDHQLLLTGPFTNFCVDVHGEQRAGAVEDGGERAHQRGQHH